MLPDDILFQSVHDLSSQISARKISPVELTQSYLARLETLGPKLGATAAITADLALQQARQAEKEIAAGRSRGPLHGIPYGAKDLLATRGIATTWGAPPFRDQVFDFDATVIRKLRSAGAILVAKLSMIELAGGGGYSSASASLQGPSRCPYNLDHWAGGSSSGPGAAVPSALVGFAIGSETLGSIITPSAFSGVSGLRPTYGRVSRYGAMALSWTMDKLGPMCRSAVDCGLVLNAIAGRDPLDPTSLDTPFTWWPPQKKSATLTGKKIGFILPDFSRGGDAEVASAYSTALDVLRGLGATLEEATFPDYPYGAIATTLYTAEAASIFRSFIESGKVMELLNEPQRIGLIAALSLPAKDYLDTFRLRAEIQPALGKMFEKYDVIVAPSRNTPASRLDADLMAGPPPRPAAPGAAATTPPAEAQRPAPPASSTPPQPPADLRNTIGASNIAGLPAISVPCGFTKSNLPIGIQFVADALRDDVCIAFAAAYQSVTSFHLKRPAL